MSILASPDSDLILLPEAARKLRCHERTVYNWCKARLIPYIRLGKRKIAFRQSDLDEFLARQRTPAAV
jgi:excisionase family DNA binding protein